MSSIHDVHALDHDVIN